MDSVQLLNKYYVYCLHEGAQAKYYRHGMPSSTIAPRETYLLIHYNAKDVVPNIFNAIEPPILNTKYNAPYNSNERSL